MANQIVVGSINFSFDLLKEEIYTENDAKAKNLVQMVGKMVSGRVSEIKDWLKANAEVNLIYPVIQ